MRFNIPMLLLTGSLIAACAFTSTGVRASGGGTPPAPTTPLTIFVPESNILPAATVGQNYNLPMSTQGGGTRPVTWSIVAGKLPDGLNIIGNWGNSSTAIYGTPKRAGAYAFTVQAKDRDGGTARRTFQIAVN